MHTQLQQLQPVLLLCKACPTNEAVQHSLTLRLQKTYRHPHSRYVVAQALQHVCDIMQVQVAIHDTTQAHLDTLDLMQAQPTFFVTALSSRNPLALC